MFVVSLHLSPSSDVGLTISLSPTEVTLHATAGNMLSSIFSFAWGLLMLQCAPTLLAAPNEPLLKAGETAPGWKSVWEISVCRAAPHLSPWLNLVLTILGFLFLQLWKCMLPSCSAELQSSKGCFVFSPHSYDQHMMLRCSWFPESSNAAGDCRALCGQLAAPCSPWVGICWPAFVSQSSELHGTPCPSQAAGSLHELWQQHFSLENRSLLTSDLFGKIAIDRSPFLLPLTGKIWYKWVATQSYLKKVIIR